MRKTRSNKTSAITFSLRPDEARALRQYAKLSGVSVNTAINEILKRHITEALAIQEARRFGLDPVAVLRAAIAAQSAKPTTTASA